MRIGIHLPQFGRAISIGGIQRAATQAEALGFDDVWVSDHLVVPADQSYPGPYLYDPLMALAFAGAVTTRVGLGTSVLVATQYPSPLAVANSLASLDYLSGGRLIAGAGIGWSQAEYEALGARLRPARPEAGGDHLVVADGLAGRSGHPRRPLLPLPGHPGPAQASP